MKSDLEILTEALGKKAAKKVLKHVDRVKNKIRKKREAINKKRMDVFGWLATLSDDMKVEDFVDVQKLGEVIDEAEKIREYSGAGLFDEMLPRLDRENEAYAVIEKYAVEISADVREARLEVFDLRNMHLRVRAAKYDAPVDAIKAMLKEYDHKLLEGLVGYVKEFKPYTSLDGLKGIVQHKPLNSTETLDEDLENMDKLFDSLGGYFKKINDVSYAADNYANFLCSLPNEVKKKFSEWYIDTLDIFLDYKKHFNDIREELVLGKRQLFVERHEGRECKMLYDSFVKSNPLLKDSLKTVEDVWKFYDKLKNTEDFKRFKRKNDSEDKK